MNLKEKILSEYDNGFVVITTCDGLRSIKLDEFIEQPVDGILYDLNRDEATVLTFVEVAKWVDDYAVCKTIRALKSRIDILENAIMLIRESLNAL